jgi:hypothetical protein
MCSVQDSVLPQGVGRRKPHLSLLLSSSPSSLFSSYFLSPDPNPELRTAAQSLPPFSLLLSLTPLFFLLPFYLLFCVKKGKI